MDQRSFVRRRGRAWERLELLLARTGRRGLRALDAAELFEAGKLYRWVTSDLAYAQGHGYSAELQHYLNRLVARSHAVVYGAAVEPGRARIARFFTHTFPKEFRDSWPYVGASAALTIVWAVIAFALVSSHPADAYALLPESIVPSHIIKSLHDSNFAFTSEYSAAMSSTIITNNIKVAVFVFAGGIVTLGLFTVYELALTGLMVGAMGALYGQAGFGADFWATIAPHGVIELSAIQVAAGAGFLLAAGVLHPGRLSRRDAIAQNGRRAGILIGGVVAMLCVAGMIEGFFTNLRTSISVRESVGVFTALALVAYLGFAGRER
ncbi:MAG TPA: stage II sporulation protein M [Candidatus Rubrimentiphilum sp.]|nr:stage II sporulation protein M [Candidatus Rubrimentiphilum sp.]